MAGARLLLVAVVAVLQLSGSFTAVGLGIIEAANPPFLYRQVTSGGLRGLLLATGFLGGRSVLRGIALGTAATMALFFFFFPLRTANGIGPGFAGMNVGMQLPLFALIANAGWGVVAAVCYQHLTRGDRQNLQADRQAL